DLQTRQAPYLGRILESTNEKAYAAAVDAYVTSAMEWYGRLLTQLRVPWPSLAEDLTASLVSWVYEEHGVAMDVTISVIERTNAVTLSFSSQPDEDPWDAIERLRIDALRAEREILAGLPRSGRALNDSVVKSLRRGARWWVEHHIVGTSKRQLAVAYREQQLKNGKKRSGETDDRRQVQNGLSEVERVLGLDIALVVRVAPPVGKERLPM
ncbi:MAG: hypothetical protein ABJA98_19305, partial [Acidobacteriota bacterium]